jgi:hypothetical protein
MPRFILIGSYLLDVYHLGGGMENNLLLLIMKNLVTRQYGKGISKGEYEFTKDWIHLPSLFNV